MGCIFCIEMDQISSFLLNKLTFFVEIFPVCWGELVIGDLGRDIILLLKSGHAAVPPSLPLKNTDQYPAGIGISISHQLFNYLQSEMWPIAAAS